jgi:hypothetical protein
MKKVFRKLTVSALLALAAGAASAADVTVTYIQPENFSDIPTGGEREETLRNLTAHFVKLGAKLPAGQQLRIDVLDIDMAGVEQPSGGRTDMRVTTRGAWPRISLHYSLESNGQVLSNGAGELRDTAFLDRPNRYMDHDTIRFEKKMVDTWFEKTILPAAGR